MILPKVGRVLSAAIVALACLIGPPSLAAADGDAATGGYRHYSIGDPQVATPAPTSAALMLMGGGDWADDAFRWFVDKAGHGHILILRASGADDLQRRLHDRIGGMASVQTLVFDDRRAATDAFVLDLVRKADGIFIAGGDQSRYIRFWKGTALNVALDAHVRNGKPLGGTSAGLAILGGVGYGALDGGSITSPVALKDPLGAAVTLDVGFLHMPWLATVITDTHFAKRERLGRLLAFLAKAQHEGLLEHPLGLGVDENSVLCVDANGSARLFSTDGGYAWLVRPPAHTGNPSGHTALTMHNVAITGIGPQSRFDLTTFAIAQPAFEQIADVEHGELRIRPSAVDGSLKPSP